MFYDRQYPTYHLFAFIAQEILKLIEIDDIIIPSYSSYANHILEPIYPNVIKFLELDNSFKSLNFNFKCNIIEYIMCCKQCNINKLLLLNRRDGKKHVIEINKIINSNRYR